MNNDEEKIDFLLKRNTAEQLAEVDWEKLNAAISSRLDEARPSKSAPMRLRPFLKVAACVAAAAVILVAVLFNKKSQPDIQLKDGRFAVVEIIESKGSAYTDIEKISAGLQVNVHIAEVKRAEGIVDITPVGRRLAKCDIEIMDVEREKNGSRAAWIIISRVAEPLYADNGVSRDMMDMICLF